jgi:hypothetical protein
LAFSGRERDGRSFQKPNDLAREAVGCMGLLARCRLWALLHKWILNYDPQRQEAL